jgi:hypothetical protein
MYIIIAELNYKNPFFFPLGLVAFDLNLAPYHFFTGSVLGSCAAGGCSYFFLLLSSLLLCYQSELHRQLGRPGQAW